MGNYALTATYPAIKSTYPGLLACDRRRISGRRFSITFRRERSDERKYVCGRRLRTTGRDFFRALAEEVEVKIRFLAPKV